LLYDGEKWNYGKLMKREKLSLTSLVFTLVPHLHSYSGILSVRYRYSRISPLVSSDDHLKFVQNFRYLYKNNYVLCDMLDEVVVVRDFTRDYVLKQIFFAGVTS
jgi:hypothetical protein